MSVTGTFVGLDGNPESGLVCFMANDTRTVEGGEVVNGHSLTVRLVRGKLPDGFSLIRLVNGYRVVEHLAGQDDHSYQLPDQAGPVDLSTFS